jgi:hypothetical protein
MALVFDEPEQEGVTICYSEDEVYLEVVDGIPMFAVFQEDSEIEEMIAILQNKLNARRL